MPACIATTHTCLHRVIACLQTIQDGEVSPVIEVAIFLEKDKIRERINRRVRVELMEPARIPYSRQPAQPVQTGRPAVIDQMDVIDITALASDDTCDDDTMDYSQDAADPVEAAHAGTVFAIPIATTVPIETGGFVTPARGDTQIPQTLQRLWREVRAIPDNKTLDHGMCPHGKCIYCRGPPMSQRYALLERLSQLEHFLYGV